MEKVNSKNEIDIKIDDFFGQVPSFKKFLQSQQIDPEEYKNNLKEYRKKGKRFVRISSHLEKAEKQNIEELIKSCGGEKTLLENVFSLPLEKTISNLEIYQTGKIYGIDFGSIFVVEALNAKEGEKVLDICCAPGAKLLYIAEKVKVKEKGFIFGNDISLPRLNITKNMLKKYGYDSHVTLLNKNAKNLKNDSFECTFDKILVDVECTHDGSFKHVLKYIEPKEDRSKKIKKIEQKNDPKDDQKNSQNKQNQQKGDFGMLKPISKKEMKRRAQQLKVEKKNNWDISDFERNILNEEKIKNLNILQFDILINAISLVKRNGIVIYSTCSLSKNQNEDIVNKAIDFFKNKKIRIKVIDLVNEWKKNFDELKKYGFKEGFIKGSVRVDPGQYVCGGMFICKLIKLD